MCSSYIDSTSVNATPPGKLGRGLSAAVVAVFSTEIAPECPSDGACPDEDEAVRTLFKVADSETG